MADDDMDRMDDDEEESGEAQPERKGFGKLLAKILIFVAFGVVAIIVIIVINVIMIKSMTKTKKQVVDTRSYDPSFRPRTSPLMSRKLKPFRVNLDITDEANTQVFVQCEISLAYDGTNTALTTELVSRDDQIRSRINFIIASKRYDEINTAFKRENYLNREILNEINSLLMNGRVREIYITQFTIARPT